MSALFYNLLYIILDITIVSALYHNTYAQNLFNYKDNYMRPFYSSKYFCSYEFITIDTKIYNNITNIIVSKNNKNNKNNNYNISTMVLHI